MNVKANLETYSLSLQNQILPKVAGMSPGPELAAELKKGGFQWMLVPRSAVADPKAWYPYLKQEFLRAYTQREYVDDWMIVYRLLD